MPRFTIVIPCYNSAATLGATLDSLRAQSLGDWEALVIDDGSVDDSLDIARRFAQQDPRFRPMRNSGKGPSEARNLALSEARGEILAFCDADDLWLPGKLESLARRFADPTIDATYARVAFFDAEGTRSSSRILSRDVTVSDLLGENPVCTMSNLALRADVFRARGGLDARIVHNEDLEFLIRLVGEGHRLAGIDEVQVMYRTSVTGLSADLPAMAAGRLAALTTAARYGNRPSPRDEAIHLRYLTRRALRTGAPRRQTLGLALRGLGASPRGWFSDLRRGALTLGGALMAPILPAALRKTLFAN
ncbi:Glycosyltransferase involved in cell wall bisynthesis [Pseudooceanicola antarcticus]|uniref:Glycosyltransferase family 2 protein n=1 Tax=Pseudooceanicola antarcticus TaxID=1247613 RepID=A0A285IJN4_9RHOB|nr:glycosyltransferase family A protein [Pseudooceanicola antarcticus]PJE28791.1 glycosyltransferase family 2 protein [Pseudooceanicola antarcticus]SNY48230.1 Glycosyltransferase involved in cell wall bisynthesis [Pseudooceanicola antarcticus]